MARTHTSKGSLGFGLLLLFYMQVKDCTTVDKLAIIHSFMFFYFCIQILLVWDIPVYVLLNQSGFVEGECH